MSSYIDTHAHLYLEEFESELDMVVNRAVDAGVRYILMPNVDLITIDSIVALWEKYPLVCMPMMGLHPTSVKKDYECVLEKIYPWVIRDCMVAVGETGIDLYWDKTFFREQVESFKMHIEWALKYDMPIVIHSRNSLDEISEVLEDYRNSGLRGVMHCFPGDMLQAEWFIEYGFMLGIGGVVTYKNSMMAKVVQYVDLENILLETDAPYLPPVPHRGKRNQPEYLPFVAQKVAEIKQLSLEEVAQTTFNNAFNLFKINQKIKCGR